MTLQEALQTKKNIRRKGERGWYSPTSSKFDVKDVLADDWEVEIEPVRITITKEQFWEAYDKVISTRVPNTVVVEIITSMAKKLGLE